MLEALLGTSAKRAVVGWTKLANPPVGPGTGVKATSIGTDLYIFGGNTDNSLFKYDTLTNVWTKFTQKGPIARSKHGMAAIGDKIYICSGVASPYAVLNDLWCFDTVLLTWTSLAAPGYKLAGHGFLSFKGKIYSISGSDDNTTRYSAVNVYDTATNKWTSIGNLPTVLAEGAAVVMNDCIYQYAGNITNSSTSPALYRSPDGVTWTKLADGYPRYYHAATAIGDTLYTFGGAYPALSALASFKEDVGWTYLNPPGNAPAARWGHTLTAIEGKIYMFGGRSSAETNEFWLLSV